MKSQSKLIWGLVGLAVVVGASMLPAADVTTTYPLPVPANNPYAAPDYSRTGSIAVSASNAVNVALNAQALLLKEMLQEHESRAAELKQQNQTEKANWELDLVNELQQKNARVQKSIDQISRSGLNNAIDGGNADPELVLVSIVEARLAKVHEDLSVAIADSRVMSVQIATNTSPQTIAAIAAEIGDNQRLVNELQREQLDLELRKLEFRAIRKAMQK
jgi:hypothetical protein